MYSENRNSRKEKDRKKIIIALLLLVCFSLLIVGVVASFYSDFIDKSINVTSGTLKISGNYTYYVNGTQTSVENINNLNPGDVIVVKGTIANNGNKSAWIRDIISFDSTDSSILPYLTVYEGEFTQTQISAGDLSEFLLPLSQEWSAVSLNKVINGSGADAEIETGNDYEYLASASYDVAITILFNSTATNETQGKTFSLKIATQALQFRNNNATEPDEDAWATVSAVIG